MSVVPIAAEPVATIAGFAITNSVVNGLLAVAFFSLVALALGTRRLAMVPKGLQNFAELLLEEMLGFMDRVTGSRATSRKFLPIVGTLFLYILFSNWVGLVPGVGSLGINAVVHGEKEFLPLFRPVTSDLNATLAMALFSVVISHIIGAVSVGFFRYANKFIKLGDLWHALVGFTKKPIGQAIIGLFVAIIEIGVGVIEVISEVAKIISLSLRLFGNVFAGEVLLTVISGLVAYGLPLPFMALELMVGIVQAIVFSTLVLVYLSLAVTKPHGHDDGEQHAKAAHEPAHATS
jgi:F-type H+-transporting ATPase subunit a